MKAVAYLRVSSKKQDLDIQFEKLKAWSEYKKIKPYLIITEKITATSVLARPNFQKLLELCRAGEVDMIVCYKLDRLFRNLRELKVTWEEFEKLNIKVVSMTEDIDTSTAVGNLLFNILGSFAEFEVSTIKERVTDGVRAAIPKLKKKGRTWGPVQTKYNYKQLYAATKLMSYRAVAAKYNATLGAVQRAVKFHT